LNKKLYIDIYNMNGKLTRSEQEYFLARKNIEMFTILNDGLNKKFIELEAVAKKADDDESKAAAAADADAIEAYMNSKSYNGRMRRVTAEEYKWRDTIDAAKVPMLDAAARAAVRVWDEMKPTQSTQLNDALRAAELAAKEKARAAEEVDELRAAREAASEEGWGEESSFFGGNRKKSKRGSKKRTNNTIKEIKYLANKVKKMKNTKKFKKLKKQSKKHRKQSKKHRKQSKKHRKQSKKHRKQSKKLINGGGIGGFVTADSRLQLQSREDEMRRYRALSERDKKNEFYYAIRFLTSPTTDQPSVVAGNAEAAIRNAFAVKLNVDLAAAVKELKEYRKNNRVPWSNEASAIAALLGLSVLSPAVQLLLSRNTRTT